MTADERLNQLEPLISEALHILDDHTKQLQELKAATGQIITLVTQQSENISFLLSEQLKTNTQLTEIRGELYNTKNQFSVVRNHLAGITVEQETTGKQLVELKNEQFSLKTDVADLKTEQTSMNGKLDLLIQLLQKPGQ